MDNNETLMDIVAEMRGEKGFPVPFAPMRGIWLSDYHAFADRIEAAWKRDASDAIKAAMMCKCEICKEVHANAAKMREALCEIQRMAHEGEGEHNLFRCQQWAANINNAAKAALDAPVRNCDRFASWEEAKAAFWKEVGDPCDWRKLGAWLFAKVEKEEGAE